MTYLRGSLVLSVFVLIVVQIPSRALALIPQLKVSASDAASGDEFGGDVAIDQNVAIVGARFNDDAGNRSGSAYLYNATTGQQLFKLIANDAAAEDWFGISVGVSGSMAIVGSYQDDVHGSNSGSAYLFDVTTGLQLRKLAPVDGAADDGFGNSVSLSGTTALVGSYNDDNKGSAYIYDAVTGQMLHKFAPADLTTDAYFGGAVAINENTAIVGAGSDNAFGFASGSAYLFDVLTGNQLFKLTPDDAQSGKQFGQSVAIDGTTAIVGNVDGAAYVFDTITGQQLFKLAPQDLEDAGTVYISVAISGNLALLGAGSDSDHGIASGSTYVFDVTTGAQLHKLTAFDASFSSQFGSAVAIDGSRAIIGARSDDSLFSNAGSVYLSTVPEPSGLILLVLACFGQFRRGTR